MIDAFNIISETNFPEGHLPGPGGILDQPAVFVQAARFIRRLRAEHVESQTGKDR